MKDDIQSLKALQETDLEISKIIEALAVDSDEIERQSNTIAELKASIEELSNALADSETKKRELEAAVEDAQVMIKDRQNKLMNVQTNREYQSILKEIEDAKAANRDRDDELVRLMEQTERHQQKVSEQKAECEAAELKLAEDSEKTQKTAEKLLKKRKTKERARNSRSKKVKENLLKKYEMIREKRDGLALVVALDGVCHGCFMNVPPQMYNELLREDKMIPCPTCNRLMYYQPPADD